MAWMFKQHHKGFVVFSWKPSRETISIWENIFSTCNFCGPFFRGGFFHTFEPPFETRNFPQVDPELPEKSNMDSDITHGGIITICNGTKSVAMEWSTGLVGGWTNPSEKYDRQNGFIFPNFRDENKEYLKPPPSGLMEVHPVSCCWWFRNPVNSPVEVDRFFPHYLQGFLKNPRWLFGTFSINSINQCGLYVVDVSLQVDQFKQVTFVWRNVFFQMWRPNPFAAPQIEPPTKPAFQFSIGNICHSSHYHGTKKWDASNIGFLSFRLYNFPLPWLWEKGYTFYIFIHSFMLQFPATHLGPKKKVPKPWFPAISTVPPQSKNPGSRTLSMCHPGCLVGILWMIYIS